MVALMQALREPSDGHRRLALAVELVEPWPENAEGALQIGDVHRSAAVINRAQVRYVGSGDLRRMYEPGSASSVRRTSTRADAGRSRLESLRYRNVAARSGARLSGETATRIARRRAIP